MTSRPSVTRSWIVAFGSNDAPRADDHVARRDPRMVADPGARIDLVRAVRGVGPVEAGLLEGGVEAVERALGVGGDRQGDGVGDIAGEGGGGDDRRRAAPERRCEERSVRQLDQRARPGP